MTEPGWVMLAKAIVTNDGGLSKYIDFAMRWKIKEDEWNQTINFCTSANSTKTSTNVETKKIKTHVNRKNDEFISDAFRL
jgi:hypothetical protein